MKKFIIYLMIIFSLCCSSAWACSVNEECSNKGHADTSRAWSECRSSWSMAAKDSIDILISRDNAVISLSDCPYYTVFTRDYGDHIRYEVYYSTEAVYYDNSSGNYIVPSSFFLCEVIPTSTLTSKSCKDSWYAWSGSSTSGRIVDGTLYTVSLSNYDIADKNGSIVNEGVDIDKLGTIEITEPPHTDDGVCVQVGSNKVKLCITYTKTCILGYSGITIDVVGYDSDTGAMVDSVNEYEIVDSSHSYDENTGIKSGYIYIEFELPYATPSSVSPSTNITVSFYDDLNNYISDTVRFIMFENESDVADGLEITSYDREHGGTGGTIPDYDGSSGGSSSGSSGEHGGTGGSFGDSSGSSSSSSGSKIKNFFKEANETVLLIGDFFGNFFGLIGSVFSFLPDTFTSILIAGLVFVILLRIFGR